jgi:metal-responsive CopG/Arc/MetJ family transcriptional regulator
MQEVVSMVRINITMPEDIVKDLKRVKNKSRYIAEALREKFQVEKKKETERILAEAYKQAAQDERHLNKEWDNTVGDGIE